MARIPYVDAESCHWLTKEILQRRNNRNIHRMLGHSGPLADAFVRLATTLRYESTLDPGLRELAILRVGVLAGADYEVAAHRDHGKLAGLTDAQIACIEAGDTKAEVLTPLHKTILQFTDEVVRDVRPSDETFAAAASALNPRDLVELVVAIGFYMAACRFLVAFDIDMMPKLQNQS